MGHPVPARPNKGLLLDRYPGLLVARCGGEPTIGGLLAHRHGDIPRAQVPGLSFHGGARGGAPTVTRRRTAKPVARDTAGDILSELDLLSATFKHHGVTQLETSCGCTNFCSFCPRGHKGTRSGASPDRLPWILDEIRRVFARSPEVSRTLYLDDEEIIGRGQDAVDRVLHPARTVHGAGFRWESSCRIDQVVRLDQGTTWHVERARMWRQLVHTGPRRMLFGVDSVLERLDRGYRPCPSSTDCRALGPQNACPPQLCGETETAKSIVLRVMLCSWATSSCLLVSQRALLGLGNPREAVSVMVGTLLLPPLNCRSHRDAGRAVVVHGSTSDTAPADVRASR